MSFFNREHAPHKTERRRGKQLLESEREDPNVRRRLRRELVEQIRRYHWDRSEGYTPSLEKTVLRFRNRTTPADIRNIVCYRTDYSEG